MSTDREATIREQHAEWVEHGDRDEIAENPLWLLDQIPSLLAELAAAREQIARDSAAASVGADSDIGRSRATDPGAAAGNTNREAAIRERVASGIGYLDDDLADVAWLLAELDVAREALAPFARTACYAPEYERARAALDATGRQDRQG